MIRTATIADLPKLEACAREFYASSRFLVGFSLERFCETWRILIGKGMGVIFVDDRDGLIAGAIGGIIHQDICGESLIASEAFWFVQEECRGSGIRLYRRFENWACVAGAASIQMVHLLDSMPDRLESFYRRMGYEPIETRYSKVLA